MRGEKHLLHSSLARFLSSSVHPSDLSLQFTGTPVSVLQGPAFLNMCRMQTPPGFLYAVAGWVAEFVNPRTQAYTVLGIIVALPFLLFRWRPHGGRRAGTLEKATLERHAVAHVVGLNYLHRICYSLVLDVALYAIFRQRRPCACLQGGKLVPVGSRYGMPSGDAMAGGILGAFLFDTAPVYPIISRVLGIVIILAVNVERMLLGMHTLAQVTVGSLLGVCLHFFSTRTPQRLIFLDATVQFVMGMISLHLDPNLVYGRNDMNNLLSWFWWGVAFQAFVLLMLWRFYHTRGLKHLLNRSITEIVEGGLLLISDSPASGHGGAGSVPGGSPLRQAESANPLASGISVSPLVKGALGATIDYDEFLDQSEGGSGAGDDSTSLTGALGSGTSGHDVRLQLRAWLRIADGHFMAAAFGVCQLILLWSHVVSVFNVFGRVSPPPS